MQYMGGKAKIAPKIVPVILERSNVRGTLIEPFIGSGWVTCKLAPHFDEVRAYDTHEDLVLMWQGILSGSWCPPEETSREEYMSLRYAEPSPQRGFIGFGMSYAGKWFGGYTGGGNQDETARLKAVKAKGSPNNYIRPARNGLMKKAAAMNNVSVDQMNFFDLPIMPSVLLYCDPPYNDTTGYGGKFDSDAFWNRCDEWAKVSDVFVSEGTAPDDWETVWETQVYRSVNTNTKQATEKLFYKGPFT